MHFYEYFEWLCKANNVSVPQAYNGAIINKGTVSRWRSACADGVAAVPSTKVALALSKYFNIPLVYIFDMKWKDGVEASEWIERGKKFQQLRIRSGYSDSKAASMAMLTEKQLSDFEECGIPISEDALVVLCDSIGVNTTDVFESAKESAKNGFVKPDIRAAFFGAYADDLTPEERDGLWRDAQDFAKFRAEQMRKEKKRRNG